MAVRIEPHAEPIPGYKLLDRLGAGGFGEVWRAEAPGGIFKAVKVIHGDLHSTDNDLVRYAEQELKSLRRVKQVRHPYLLALDRFDIVEGRLMIVMELADCNLWDRFRECRDRGLPGIPRDELLLYMVETAEVLDLFNDQFQLQHLDIKPQNLFLLSNHVKVADFGQVKDLQGLVAPVTGGITPVYAAPETFDGIITRTCDQYSLACVYQELLTGIRPFDGGTMNQLLIQHLNHPPNLEPSPPCDRPALARGLAKRPEDRWPSVSSFVRGLLGTSISGRVAVPLPRSVPVEPRAGSPSPIPAEGASREPAEPLAVSTSSTPPPARSIASMEADPQREAAESNGPAILAPPEVAGPGPLRPALVIGMGRAGQQVLRRLRFDLTERYGQPDRTPIVRAILVDTDPDDLNEAIRSDPANRLAGLEPDEVFPARLNRASHYMKPRLSGRTLTDGWFDPQLLYRIPRIPQTMGVRMFGRLAFCDYYRPLMGKIHASLDAVLAADAMTQTETSTGLLRRTNRPLVFVVAGLSGGTGGGMLLDMAYAVRNRLKRIGYESPEVVGVLVVPPADPAKTPQQPLANTFAALTELHHYSRPDTSFVAHYDERHGVLREKDPPFLRCYIVPGPAPERRGSPGANGHARTPSAGTPPTIMAPGSRVIAKPGSRVIAKPGSRVMPALGAQPELEPLVALAALKPYGDIADLIRLNLFSPLGRRIDETRAAMKAANPECSALAAFGVSGFGWPRAEVVARTSHKAARAVLRRWAAPNAQRMREVIPALAQEHWSQLGLDPDAVQSNLQRIAKETIGSSVDDQIARLTDPLVPRGWLGRLPVPEKVALALDQLSNLFGTPGSSRRRQVGEIEHAVAAAAAEAAGGCGLDAHALVPTLVDDPQFRLSGAEDMLRQFHTTTDRLIDRFLQAATDEDAKARTAFNAVAQYAHYKKGMRKPSGAEFVEALRQYPKSQFQALLARQSAGVYHAVREVLAQQLADVSAARARLESANKSSPVLVAEISESPAGGRLLMPPGCNGIAEAVEKFAEIITEADLNEIDRRVQVSIEPDYGTVFQACLNSTTGSEDVIAAVYEESRAHLEARLGMANLASMFKERYCTPSLAERALGKSYLDAEPALGKGPWAADEVVVVGCPAGEAGEPLRELAGRAIPVPLLPFADTPDDLTVYREWPDVPLSSLPHAGSLGEEAFRLAGESQQCTSHCRIDVAVWMEAAAT